MRDELETRHELAFDRREDFLMERIEVARRCGDLDVRHRVSPKVS